MQTLNTLFSIKNLYYCQNLLSSSAVRETDPAVRGQLVEVVEPTGVAPKFSKLLTDILAPEGNKVTFECCVNGDPKPDIKWYLNNEEIHHSDHIQVNTTQQYVHVCGHVGDANGENEMCWACDGGGIYTGFWWGSLKWRPPVRLGVDRRLMLKCI